MREKNYNIEILRVLACMMVIVIHVANYFCRAYGSISTAEYVYALVFNTFARVSVPCFFMISGSLLLDRNENLRTCFKRAGHIFSVLLVWSVFYYLFNTYYTHQECSLKELLIKPAEAHLWYLYVLVPIYVMLPFLQAMVRGMDEKLMHGLAVLGAVWIVLLVIVSCMGWEFYYNLPILGDRSYIYYFFLGYYLKKYLPMFKISMGKLLGSYCITMLLAVGLTMVCSFETEKHFENILQYGNPLIVLGSVSFFGCVMKLGNGQISLSEKCKHYIDLFASCSFGIYLIHIVFLDIYKVHIMPNAYPVYWVLPLLVIVIAAVSLFCIYFINNSKTNYKML